MIDHYEADVQTAQDYYPFGMIMPGRMFTALTVPGGSVSGTTTVNGFTLPVDLTLSSRSGNEPTQYVASHSIDLDEGFESGVNDDVTAYIADTSYAGGGNGGSEDGIAGTSRYRYAFGGQEKDDEIKGAGNSYTAQFWEYDPRIGRRWNLDPKPSMGFSPYSSFNNNPISFNDPFGDTLSNPQLVDALKIANNEVRNRLIKNDDKGFYNEGATKALGQAIASYAEKNKLSNADLGDFYKAAHQYYNGLGTMAENNVIDYLQFNAQVLNSKTLDTKNTLIASNYFLKKSSNEFGLKWTAAYKSVLEAVFGAAFPMSAGKAPRVPISNYEKLEQLFKAGFQQSFEGEYWLLSKTNISNGVFRKEVWGLAVQPTRTLYTKPSEYPDTGTWRFRA